MMRNDSGVIKSQNDEGSETTVDTASTKAKK